MMFPVNRVTNRVTPIYNKDFKTIRLTVKKGAKLQIKSVSKEIEGAIYGETPGGWALLRDAQELYVGSSDCLICFDATDDFFGNDSGRATQMKCCSQWVHDSCLESMVKAGHSGKMIGFNHVKCPGCRKSLVDPYRGGWRGNLYRLILDERNLYLQIKKMRENLNQGLSKEETPNWAFFKCVECTHPFCGGKVSCAEEFDLDPSSMVCDGCDWAKDAEDHRCFEHGKDFAVFKCDFCCSPASWACGSTHYCTYCHDHGGYQHPTPCPGPGKCPLGMPHPPPITNAEKGRYVISFVIGCQKCNNPDATIEYKSYNPDPFKVEEMKKKYHNVVQKFEYSKYQWSKQIDLQGGHLLPHESDDSDSEEELEDIKLDKDEIEVNGVQDGSQGDKAPVEKHDDIILLHAPILPPPAMVAQSS